MGTAGRTRNRCLGWNRDVSQLACGGNEERDEFVRARVRSDEDGVVLEPVVGQESHMIVRSSSADALVHVPRGNGELVAGSLARWFRLGD